MLAAPCDPFSFNNGGVTTYFVHTLSTPATKYVQLIGLQSADPQSRPFIAANQEGKHFSFVDSLLDPNLWTNKLLKLYAKDRCQLDVEHINPATTFENIREHSLHCDTTKKWFMRLKIGWYHVADSIANIKGLKATVTNAQPQHGIDPEKDSGKD
ncbi:hypothetical protein Tco_1057052 [Tanacetum coccineum]|uniref:Uncharacterized protein n=1 Tax=Tanacetum coccineum TaxID=301880 RepID=A0ABQ5H5S6_9ASTR